MKSADDMDDENSQFRQGSSTKPQGGPQYYGAFGSRDGSTTFDFDEDDDDYEVLLDEGLAADGLYRGKYT